MADTGKRLGPIAGTGVEATLYTCGVAAGFHWRHLRVVNTTTTTQTFKMSIGADAAGTRLFHDQPVDPAPSPPLDMTFYEFVANAETIRWNGPATLTVTLSGVEATT